MSGSCDTYIKIWNATTGTLEMDRGDHTGCVNSVVWDNNGTRLVSGSDGNTVRVWNVIDGSVTSLLLDYEVLSVGFNEDGSRIVAVSPLWTSKHTPQSKRFHSV